ncbi:MAG TPA: hypothetical protein VD947_00005, partial [Patescibacteria group bacterium]|nr:hypothetical protein [Patescibacteria group bacterium]
SSSSDVDITAAKAEKVITEKDNYTRELFQRLYDFDLFSDHDNFDIILDTSGFIENTPQKKGVQIATERFLPIAMRAILSASSKPQDSNAPTTPSSLPQVINLNPALVT